MNKSDDDLRQQILHQNKGNSLVLPCTWTLHCMLHSRHSARLGMFARRKVSTDSRQSYVAPELCTRPVAVMVWLMGGVLQSSPTDMRLSSQGYVTLA